MGTTKKRLLCFILSCVMIFSNTIIPTSAIQAEETVLVTRTGSRYHTHKCGNGTYYRDTLSAARARGLTPCQKCYRYGSDNSSSNTSSNISQPSSQIAIPQPKPKPISLNTYFVELVKGDSKKLTARNASGTIIWKSNKPSVATVSNGTVTGKSKGSAKISAHADDQTVTCTVKVEEPRISHSKLTIKASQGRQIKITGCSHAVSWKTQNKDIASVTKNGYIFANGMGTTTVTANVHKKNFTCKVTVKTQGAITAANIQYEMDDNIDVTSDAPAKKDIEEIAEYFNSPAGWLILEKMGIGDVNSYDFSENSDRKLILNLCYQDIKRKRNFNKANASMALFLENTSNIDPVIGNWGTSCPINKVKNIYQTEEDRYKVVCGVYWHDYDNGSKDKRIGTLRLYLKLKTRACYGYVLKNMSIEKLDDII